MPHDTPQPFIKALPWLLSLSLVFFFNFSARVILSPLLPTIETELGLDHARAGRLFMWSSLGYGLSMLGSGILASRITHRTVIALSAAAMMTMLAALASCHNRVGFEILLFSFGLATGLYLPSGVVTATSMVAPKDFGKAIAVHELAPNLALLTTPLLAAIFLSYTGWRTGMIWLGLASGFIGIGYGIVGCGGRFYAVPPKRKRLVTFLRQQTFWRIALLFCLAIGASIGPYSMLPLFLTTEHGLSLAKANQLLTLSRVVSLITATAVGAAVDRLGPQRTIKSYLLLTGATTVALGMTQGPWLTATVLCQSVCAVTFFPAGFAALALLYPARLYSEVVALIISLSVIVGNGLTPAILGWMGRDGNFGLGFVALGLLVWAGLWILMKLRLPDHTDPKLHLSHQ
ncbi:MFS transporter [Desulfovibrionales bacterium]